MWLDELTAASSLSNLYHCIIYTNSQLNLLRVPEDQLFISSCLLYARKFLVTEQIVSVKMIIWMSHALILPLLSEFTIVRR